MEHSSSAPSVTQWLQERAFGANLTTYRDVARTDRTALLRDTFAITEAVVKRHAPPEHLTSLRDTFYPQGDFRPLDPLSESDLVSWLNCDLEEIIRSLRRTRFAVADSPTRRFADAFDVPYRGEALNSFRRSVDSYQQIYSHRKYFGRVISLWQSGVMGKSRLMKELGKVEPTLSICVRPYSYITGLYEWPPQDTEAWRFLQKDEDLQDSYMGEELSAAFLGALIWEIVDSFQTSLMGTSVLPACWDLYTGAKTYPRHERFHNVYKRAKSTLRGKEAELRVLRPARVSIFEDEPAAETLQRVDAWCKNLVYKLCKDALSKLATILQSRGHSRFFLAFDEAKSLGHNSNASFPEIGMSLIALHRVMRAFDTLPGLPITCWFVLIDTASCDPLLSPLWKDASHRLNLSSLPAWTCLGFNQRASDAPALTTARDALKIDSLAYYGRPYWATVGDLEVEKAAIAKLLRQDPLDPRTNFASLSPIFQARMSIDVFVAFGNRILLDVGQTREADDMSANTVDKHLRVLINATADGITSEAPSEPILAIAAAHVLRQPRDTYSTAVETFGDLVTRGVVLDRYRGQRPGALCSRLLLIIARDFAVPEISSTSSLEIVPATLSAFLQSLLGDNLGLAANHPHLASLLRHGATKWINFTHFDRLKEPVAYFSPETLEWAWRKGIAFQCAPNQPLVDICIVTYEGDLDAAFDTRRLGVVGVRTNAQKTAARAALVSTLTPPALLMDEGDVSHPYKREHVVLVMDIATETKFRDNGMVQLTFAPAQPSPPPALLGWLPAELEPNRWCLHVRGCAPAQYPITATMERPIAQMVKSTCAGTDESEAFTAARAEAFEMMEGLPQQPSDMRIGSPCLPPLGADTVSSDDEAVLVQPAPTAKKKRTKSTGRSKRSRPSTSRANKKAKQK